MIYRAVIFDLDGTLLNTLDDLAAAANRTMASQGYPTHPVGSYRRFVGDGSAKLIERAMPVDQRTPERVAQCLAIHLDDYNHNWDHATRPYEGIPELLDTLTRQGIPMSVVTNKPHDQALMTLAHFLGDIRFTMISGLHGQVKKKPDPEQALAAAQAMNVSPDQCLFLGDSDIDIHTARNAGMVPVGAAWGFRTEAELRNAGARFILQHPMELIDKL